MYYVIGLGNPGEKYDGTRHNVGRMVVAEMAKEMGSSEFVYDKFARALRADTASAICILPETFMNKSGETVDYLIKKESVTPAQMIVVFDDVNIPFGDIKISYGKSHGGHNGARDVERALGTRDYIQVRVGVAQKGWWSGEAQRPAASALAGFVLQKFSFFERRHFPEVLKKGKQTIDCIISDGPMVAMNTCN